MKRYLIFIFTVMFLLVWAGLLLADNRTDSKGFRGKSVDAGLLPEELKSIQIEDNFIKSNESDVGTIQKASGHVVVLHKDSNKAFYATAGDAVYQQDVFYTLKDSRCRIRFKTEDIITMGENGKIIVEEVSEDSAAKEKKSVMSMLRGKTMFYVMRLFKYRKISASVKTPTAVMGVRGTKFGVEVRKAGEKIADLSDESLIYLAENGSGNFETIIHGFDGSVGVTSNADGSTNTVGAGESLFVDNLGAGNVEPTDPNIANQFIQQTEGGGFILAGLLGSGADDAGDVIDNIITTAGADGYLENISQNITTLTTLTTDVSTRPVNKLGYFTAMLKANIPTVVHGGTYTSTSLQNLANPDAEAKFGSYSMKIDASSGMSDAKLTNLATSYGDTISGNYPITSTERGHNAYMEWGDWTQPLPMSGTYTYYVDNKGYYIVGDPTSATDMMTLLHNASGWWSYTGGAEGTYWTSTGGTDMTGTFDAKVNFMDGAIEEFNLSVSKDGFIASVENASGSLTTGSPEFQLSGGAAQIDSTSMGFTANGSFYGPAANSIGGAWAIEPISAGTDHATGIFHGTNQGSTTAPLF
ncbi:MAG: FecR family protein [Pseudomonadota bacterium]